MPSRDPRVPLIGVGFVAALASWGVRDLPAQLDQVRFERARLGPLDTEARRVEMHFPPPDKPERRQHYIGMRQYLEFMEKIREETPDDARVGIRGLPMESLYKFAHYHLYPRHPFPIDGRDPVRVKTALSLDYVATFDVRGGRVERAR